MLVRLVVFALLPSTLFAQADGTVQAVDTVVVIAENKAATKLGKPEYRHEVSQFPSAQRKSFTCRKQLYEAAFPTRTQSFSHQGGRSTCAE